jgi:hypothetical protein
VPLVERRDESPFGDPREYRDHNNLLALPQHVPGAEYGVVEMGRKDDDGRGSTRNVFHD